MLLGTLVSSILGNALSGNALSGKKVKRAREGTIRAGQNC